MKFGIAAKLTKLEWDSLRLNKSENEILDWYQETGVNTQRVLDSHNRQKNFINQVTSSLEETVMLDTVSLEKNRDFSQQQTDVDAILALGGDNYFQRCAHWFGDKPIAGMNTDNKTSAGALLEFDQDNLLANNAANFKYLASGNYQTNNWTRINTYINGKQLSTNALCDVSLTNLNPDMQTRIKVEFANQSYDFKSSGILVATGCGTTEGSWYWNAGRYMQLLDKSPISLKKNQKSLAYITREPSFRSHKNAMEKLNTCNNTIEYYQKLSIRYLSNDDGGLSLDSIDRYTVKQGDLIELKVSNDSLNIIKSL